jgi:hypothetical protein
MYPGLSLLSAFGLNTMATWLPEHRLPRRALWAAAAVGGAALLVLFAYYPYTVFIRTQPEYRAAYPSAKSPIYWTTYDELPARDYFGFPHRAGWKAINALYEQGVLEGEYDSNEGGEITAWYLPQAPRHYCKPRPRYYFVAESVQDAGEIPEDTLAFDFSPIGLVTVEGRPGIHVYERGAPQGGVAEYVVEDYEGDFDGVRTPWDRLTVMERFITTPYAADFGGVVELMGYDLDTSRSCPGGEVVLTLYWRRSGPPIPEDYKVFVHLEGEGQLWAQADDVPGCAAWPTTRWREREIVADRHVIVLGPGFPAGDYSLSVGLYEPAQGTRLDVMGDAGASQGNHLTLATVAVQESCEESEIE